MNFYHRFARALILIGGILGLVIAMVSLTMIPFMAGILGFGYGMMWQYGGMMMVKYDLFGYPQFGLDMMPGVMTIWSLLGLFGGSLSVCFGLRRERHNTRNLTFVSTIGGVLLLLSFSWLPSLMVLAGSILLYFEQAQLFHA